MGDWRAVLVEHHGRRLSGYVLWSYDESGRRRALVPYDTPADLTQRELRWADQLERPRGLVLPLKAADIDEASLDRAPAIDTERDSWSEITFRAG
jgi:hypothetical protein